MHICGRLDAATMCIEAFLDPAMGSTGHGCSEINVDVALACMHSMSIPILDLACDQQQRWSCMQL